MSPGLCNRTVFAFFRMGLVTGLLPKDAPLAWADGALLRAPTPDYDLIELSLTGGQPYSQIIGLLNRLQGPPDYDLPLKLLLAHAGLLLAGDPAGAVRILGGLRLLMAEEYLPKDIRAQMTGLDADLEGHRCGDLAFETLGAHLAAFLAPYEPYRDLLAEAGLGP